MATAAPSCDRLRFDGFELVVRAAGVRKPAVKLRLRRQPLQVLAILLEHAGDLVGPAKNVKRGSGLPTHSSTSTKGCTMQSREFAK